MNLEVQFSPIGSLEFAAVLELTWMGPTLNIPINGTVFFAAFELIFVRSKMFLCVWFRPQRLF